MNGYTSDEVMTTGWNLAVADDVGVTSTPTEVELTVLRDLKARTTAAHGT